jgi:uncharacterized protein (TIGR01777 family)
MNLLVSGATGLIGRRFARDGHERGHRVRRLTRVGAAAEDIPWDPSTGRLAAAALEGIDAVVHLAGEPLATGRWTAKKKQRIVESRERGTAPLSRTLAVLECKPRTLLSASAIGIYGSRGDDVLDETSGAGRGFLADVCERWEAATGPAAAAGIRVVHLRIGVVLDREGGALRQMLPAFRAGLGGRLGSGAQWLSWVSLRDASAAMWHAIEHDEIAGPLNIVAPSPVTNAELTRTLAGLLRRPAILPVPAPLLRLAIGEMADEAVLASARVVPRRLMETGFAFEHPTLIECVRATLGR